MDDPILTETPAQPAQPATPAPQQDTSRMDRIESAMAELAETVRNVGTQLIQGQQRQAAPAQKTPDEVLTELASDPLGLIRREAAQMVDQRFQGQLGPAAASVYETVNQQIMAGHRAQIDYEFGEGAYEEIYKPQLDKDMAQLRQVNPQALSDQGTMEALVNRLTGQNFQVLRERRDRLEKTAANRGLSHLIPTGGVPRLRLGNPQEELTSDHELFIKETDRATGDRTDPKAWAKLLHSGTNSGPDRHRTTLQDYVDVVGMPKEKKEKYGLS